MSTNDNTIRPGDLVTPHLFCCAKAKDQLYGRLRVVENFQDAGSITCTYCKRKFPGNHVMASLMPPHPQLEGESPEWVGKWQWYPRDWLRKIPPLEHPDAERAGMATYQDMSDSCARVIKEGTDAPANR